MKTIVIDDEPWMLRHFCTECEGLEEIELVSSCLNPLKALEYARSNRVELAFIDMEMPQLSGAETARRLTEMAPGVKIVIVSAYDESYIREAPECASYGYLRKPYRRDDLRSILDSFSAK